ncbi:ABC transporter substrate-binding protein [Jiella sp. M17.18]|uniref:ABC transporter substrate-binding protein n=1 Tax=Jiella sp. M17.18 TaxID=3234247 RepID=UPI0034DEB0FF
MKRICRLAVAFAASLTLCPVAVSAASAADTITLGTVGSGSALNWPLLIGIDKGFFKAHDVTIDLVTAPSSASVQQQLAAGSVEMGSGGLVDPIRAIDKGAPIALIRVEAKAAPYSLYARQGIDSYADLKGKTIIVGGAKDVTRIYLQRMAEANGLKPSEYDLIYAGATSARFAALQSGAVDAALISAPFNFKAASLGLSDLGDTVDYVTDFPFTGYAVNLDWAKGHTPAIGHFLAAYSQAVTWLADPANRQEAVKILVNDTAAKPDDAEKTYDFFDKIDIYDANGKIDTAGLANLLKTMKGLGDISGDTDPTRFYDASLGAKE